MAPAIHTHKTDASQRERAGERERETETERQRQREIGTRDEERTEKFWKEKEKILRYIEDTEVHN